MSDEERCPACGRIIDYGPNGPVQCPVCGKRGCWGCMIEDAKVHCPNCNGASRGEGDLVLV